MLTVKTVALMAVVSALGMSGVAVAKTDPVRSVSDPPAKATGQFTLRVKASAARVTLYASPLRRHVRGDVKLGTVPVRGQRVKVRLPRRLASGAYFIVACPATGRGSCAASRKATLLLPKASSVLSNGSAALASGAVSGAIGESGGTLQVAGANGTVTLQIPARSLANRVMPAGCTFEQSTGYWRRACSGSTALTGPTVTLAALSSLSGIGSLGRFVAGAQMQPEGLPLIRGATATIALKRPIAKAKMIAVVCSGTGSRIHEVPLRISRGQAIVALGEIGGGVAILEQSAARAGAREIAAAAQAAANGRPASVMQVYGAVIGQQLRTLRANALIGDEQSLQSSNAPAAIQNALDAAYTEVVAKEVPAGMNSDEAARMAISDLLTLLRTKQLFGAGGEEGTDLIVKLMAAWYNRAQERCAAQPPDRLDLSLSDIIGATRQLALLGYEPLPSWDDITICARLKLMFDSTITTQWGGRNTGTHVNEYRIELPLKLNFDGTYMGESPGTGTYAQTSGSMHNDGQQCDNEAWYTSYMDDVGGTGDLANVPVFMLPFAGDPRPMLQLELGQPTESYHMYPVGAQCAANTTQKLPLWSRSFLNAHMNHGTVSADGRNVYVFTLARGTGGPTVGTRTYDATLGMEDNAYTEHTTINVVHTPGKYTPLPIK